MLHVCFKTREAACLSLAAQTGSTSGKLRHRLQIRARDRGGLRSPQNAAAVARGAVITRGCETVSYMQDLHNVCS